MECLSAKRMKRALSLQLLLFAMALLPLQALSAAPSWRLLEAPHYRVISQLSDRDTLAWSQQFDQFIATMTGVLDINPANLPPLTVVLFSRESGFAPYKPVLPNGQQDNIAGLFAPHETWSIIGLAGSANGDWLRRKILHEATHWLMSVDEARKPAWFTEGIAEVLATFEIRNQQVIWGKPIDDRLQWISDAQPDLKNFLMLPRVSMDDGASAASFYAEAWAFTHFLLFSSDASYQQLLPRFLQVYKSHSGAATLQEVVGDDLEKIERDFWRYLKARRFRYVTQPLASVPALSSPVPAPPDVVQVALGRLAYSTGNEDKARKHAEEATALNPAAPDTHELQAYLAVEEESAENVVTHAEAALKAGSRDSQMYMLLGDLLGSAPEAASNEARRQRVNLYESAINMNPRRAAPFEKLGESLLGLPQPTDDDAGFMALGLKMFPGNDWIRAGAAVVDFRLGKVTAAREQMTSALRDDSTLDDDQRRVAKGLLNGLLAGLAPEHEHEEAHQ